jgi:hypothetical protein
MVYIPIDVLPSSREVDDVFQLCSRSTKVANDYTAYVWKAQKQHFFQRCDYTAVFPLAVNLYLKTCSEEELSDLLTKQHFLRIKMYYDSEGCTTSCIAVQNLTIAGLNDPKYKDLMLSCPSGMVPSEITMGPIWHYVGFDRDMCSHRRVENGSVGMDTDTMEMVATMGVRLFGRDKYPDETTEEIIKEREVLEEIFIIRK